LLVAHNLSVFSSLDLPRSSSPEAFSLATHIIVERENGTEIPLLSYEPAEKLTKKAKKEPRATEKMDKVTELVYNSKSRLLRLADNAASPILPLVDHWLYTRDTLPASNKLFKVSSVLIA
jgi:hypothetical protein